VNLWEIHTIQRVSELSRRFMALNDLKTEISRDSSVFVGDEPVEMKTLEHVMKLVEDPISEVKNQAVLW
jgi:cullin-associated NEDD8-dissociated protein 1